MERLPFADRSTAGRVLAGKLAHYHDHGEALVLGLPRGGVPVANEVATALNLPLEVLVVRKVGAPGHKEFALGAVASDGIRIVNEPTLRAHHISDQLFEQLAQSELQELKRREKLYRGNFPPPDLQDRCVIIVDDGLATGATMRAAIEVVRRAHARKVIMAVPVAALQALNEMAQWTDESVWLAAPDPFYAVGRWYQNFEQTTDETVLRLLAQARARQHADEIQLVNMSPSRDPHTLPQSGL
jgi:putative phosphoribosyl transferase